MKGSYMFQAEKKGKMTQKNQLNKFSCPVRPWLLSLRLQARGRGALC